MPSYLLIMEMPTIWKLVERVRGSSHLHPDGILSRAVLALELDCQWTIALLGVD
jgi:hypothetical protein